MNDVLRKERLLVGRQHDLVGNHIVDEIGARRPGKPKVGRLDRRRAPRQDAEPRIGSVAFQIDGDMYFEITQKLGDLLVGAGGHIEKAIERLDQARADIAAVIGAVGYADDLEAVAVVDLK